MYLNQIKRCPKCNRLYTVDAQNCLTCETELSPFQFDHRKLKYTDGLRNKPA